MSEDKNIIKYNVSGEEVKLSPSIVNSYLKRGNSAISNAEAVNFMQLCRYNGLNPFRQEAYLVKFGNEPAQMIVSKEAYMRKAEENPEFKGFKAGVIVQRGEEVVELEGAFKLPKDILLGGWCTVYFKTDKEPFTVKVDINEYLQRKKGGEVNSMWSNKGMTMIRKVAIAQALREAFPNSLNSMYMEEEVKKKVRHEDIEEEKSSLEKELEEEMVQEVEYEEI